jgi:hypothetical protein
MSHKIAIGLPEGLAGDGNLDGDDSGLFDSLEFGVALGSHPATSLIGGMKSVAGDGSTALTAAGANSISILSGASLVSMLATGARAIAIGYDVTADGTGAIAMGDEADASAGNIAIGDGAKASNTNNVTIGSSTNNGKNQTILIGHGITANDQQTVAIGTSLGTVGGFSVVIGAAASCAVPNGIAIGNQASSNTAQGNIAIGVDADAAGGNSISLGRETRTSSTGSIAIGGANNDGAGANATANGAIAIGGNDGTNNAADANNANSVAFGSGAVASADNAWQFGIGTNSTSNCLQISGLDVNIAGGNLDMTGIFNIYDSSDSGSAILVNETTIRFNNSYKDRNYVFRKMTSGTAWLYDSGLDTHTFDGDFTVASSNEVFLNLPTSAGTAGSLWNDSGTVKVA